MGTAQFVQRTITPDARLAAEIALRMTGHAPATVRRFSTGARHYVFEAAFAARPPVVVRIGDRSAHAEMAGAVYLSRLLRPRGVPLPATLAEDVQADFPWVVLERLAGTDLGAVMTTLSAAQLDRIAAGVARAQEITATAGSAGRYGYAVRPELAPHAAWPEVLTANLERSRQRIASAGLFDVGLIGRVEARVAAMRMALAAIRPIAFLHDTTARNVIVAPDGELSGIVDVDDLCFGDPRYPAALTMAVLMAYGGPVAYVSSWLRHAGQADDTLFALYVAQFLVDLMSEHGQAFNGNALPSDPAARQSLHGAFDTVMARLQG